MASYNTANFLALVKKRAFIPENQDTFSDEDLLDMGSDEMRSIVVPAILSAREEWFVTHQDFPVDSDTTYVAIPSRAIGGRLREVSFVQGSLEYNLPRQSLEDKIYQDNRGRLSSIYLEGNKIRLMGSESGNLRVYIHCRPGKLVETSEAGLITSIDTGTNTITVSSVPISWAVGNVVDFVEGKPHFEHRQLDNSIVSITNNDIVLTDTLPTTLVVGDYIALEDESPVVQLPVEWFAYLAQAVVVQVLESLGDHESMSRAEKRRDELHKRAMQVITPRIVGETKKAVPVKNRSSVLNPTWNKR